MYKKRILLILFFILCFYLIMIQMISVGKTEVLTSLYGKEFDGIQNGMIAEIDYLKVLKYSEDKATIYYVHRGRSGNVCTFVKNQELGWEETEWKIVWSTSGSDLEMVWPYWWDAIFYRGV